MFCDNASYETERLAKNCANYCSGQGGRIPSYNDVRTEQSERNPSNYYQTLTNREERLKMQNNLQQINELENLELMHENTKRENEQLKAITRNKNIAAILSTIIAFSERIEGIKEKLAGYPGESFSPVEFFNVLDLTEKGYVDLFDIKRFVNNDRIGEKDILALFKKVNGDHAKDSSRLSYFGYLNLIKPYFNEHLARDLLLRDSDKGKKHKKSSSVNERIDNEIFEATQESVLLLFQELMLLHCICTSEHEQAKEDLMNEYMLNIIEIKQIIGLDHSENHHQNIAALSKTSGNSHKSPLKLYHEFIENNSQFEIEFKEMKFLLSFLNAHEFAIINEKYLSILFIPINCKNELLKHFQSQNQEAYGVQAQNYMNTYLTKENLINKGNIQPIREYLQNGVQNAILAQNPMAMTSKSNKQNFLEFVHPKSLRRMNANNAPFSAQNFPSEQYMDYPSYPQQPQIIEPLNEHPQMEVNPSNKFLSQNQSKKFLNPNPSQRQYSNSSSIPQENIKINLPKKAIEIKEYPSSSALNKEFYKERQRSQEEMNVSGISNTPFLEKFMKNNNNVKNSQLPIKIQKNTILNQDYSKISESKFSDSAFEVVDYGYEPANERAKEQKTYKNIQQLKYPDESQRFKKESLDSRYNLVISQYKNHQLQIEGTKRQQENKINEQSSQYRNQGPKFEKSTKINNNPVLDHSKGNYIDNVGLSQSNMVNESNFMNKFYENRGNILNEFLKK